MAKAKITMLLDLNEKLFGGKLGNLQKRWEKFEGKVGKGVDKIRDKFGRWADEIPGLGTAFDLIKNPIALAAAGMLAFGTIATKGVNAAEKFDSAFLPIRNLNLDKSKSELDSYRSKIRDATFEVGSNLVDSTNAVYDLQSATGLYGDDAIDVFKKVGKYSLATGANINDAMNSTTKAMKAFGLETSQIDQLLESNAKTVQVGITTFDELAKVQTEYAGAASSAGQGIDQANKVFAMFTSVAKNSDVGANMTKTFFQGLGQQADKFEGVLGVKVFDDKGMMRNADVLLKEISGKFQNMNDQQITEAINKIGGPEGLRGALDKVKTGAVDMIQTFDAFDSSQFSLKEALENAQGDFATMKTIFTNRMEMMFSKIGEKIIPILADLFDRLTPALNWLYENIDNVVYGFGVFATALGVAKVAMIAFNIATAANPIGAIILGITALITLIALAIKNFDKWGAVVLSLLGPFGQIIVVIKNLYDHWDSIQSAFTDGGFIAGIKRIGAVILDTILKPIQQLLEILSHIPGLGYLAKKGADFIDDMRWDLGTHAPLKVEIPSLEETEWGKKNKNKGSLYDNDATGDNMGTKGNTNNGKLQSDITKVTGSAKQTRNITVNIEALHKGDFNLKGSESSGMSLQDVQDWFNEAMTRVIRNAELS